MKSEKPQSLGAINKMPALDKLQMILGACELLPPLSMCAQPNATIISCVPRFMDGSEEPDLRPL